LTQHLSFLTISETWEGPVARILCVDDDPTAILIRKETLEVAGHIATPCSSIDEALRELEEDDYDAVVTDWRFSEESGRAIIHTAKSKWSIPVVVVTGYVGEAFQAAEPLADIYLEKPIDSRELIQILKILLEVRTDRVRRSHS
jgi:CheY-like chemotaxis protein